MLDTVYKFREIHRFAVVNVLEFIHSVSEPGLAANRFLFKLHVSPVTKIISASLH